MSQEPTTRIIVTMPVQMVKAIDKWRYANEVPSRTEAIRQMVDAALAKAKPRKEPSR